MSKKLLPVLFALAGTAVLASTAQASDGTININGRITSGTCTGISVNGTSHVGTVDLDDLTSTNAPGVGMAATALMKPITITLTGCTATMDGKPVHAYFDKNSPNVNAQGRLINTVPGGTTSADIALYDGNSNLLNLSLSDGQQGTGGAQYTVNFAAGAATLNYSTTYWQNVSTASLVSGLVLTSVPYTIAYP